MTREELELMADLKRVCNQAPNFALAFMAGDLPLRDKKAYALRLIDLGRRLLAHGKERNGLMLDGEATGLIIEAPFVRVDHG